MRLTLVVAIISGWVSLNAMLCLVYLYATGRLGGAGGNAGKRKVAGKTAPGSAREVIDGAPVLVDEKAGAWGLFVMFDEPDMALNQRLGALLASTGAVYEVRSKAFTLAGDSPRNPIHIANAYPPGTLPSFNQDDGAAPIKGLALKMLKKRGSSTPNKLQLARLVSLTREMTRLGGKAVDAEKQPLNEAGFQAVISGKARV